MDIHTIIFSKDRPAQLDLLIRSIRQHYKNFRPTIMVKCDSNEYYLGYAELAERLNIALYAENSFRYNLIRDILPSKQTYTQFLVDDQIAIRNPYENLDFIDMRFKSSQELLSWSLRLGENSWKADGGINHQADLIESLIEKAGERQHEHLEWSWTDFDVYFPNCYYATPMSVDGNIFKTDFLVDLVEDLHFNGPNQLEGAMEQEVRRRRYNKQGEISPLMSAWPSPAFVNSPNNRVQDEAQNSFGQVHPMTVEEMNRKYLEGYQLSLDFELPEVFAPHHEIELKWEKYDSV